MFENQLPRSSLPVKKGCKYSLNTANNYSQNNSLGSITNEHGDVLRLPEHYRLLICECYVLNQRNK